jgi:hypothetical protein
MWLDRFLVLVGMLGLIMFCGVIMYFVAVPDLILVVVVCLAIAIWDFCVSLNPKEKPHAVDEPRDRNRL